MWETIILTIFIIQLLLIGYLIYLCVKKQRTTIQTILYFIVIFFLNFIINFIGLIYYKSDGLLFDTLVCALNSLKAFFFDADIEEYTVLFSNQYTLYSVVYGLGVFMGAAMTIFAAVDTFKLTIINKIRVYKKLKSNCDILIGNLETCKKYYNNSNNSILWVSNMDKEQIKSLIEDGYPVINKELSANNLDSLSTDMHKYNVICFIDDEKTKLEDISIFEEYINKYENNKYHFYIEVEESKTKLIEELVLNDNLKKYITTFSGVELVVRKFVEENPLTNKLPNDFINCDTTFNNDKKINVIMIGFDNVHEELLKQLILNNQFVTINNDKYVNSLVNYYLYDESICFDNYDLIRGIERRFNKLNQKDYFELPEKIANINYKNINTNSYVMIDEVTDIVSDSNSYNYVFINNRNIDILIKLEDELKYNNIHYYVKLDNMNNNKNDITLYGDLDNVVNHEVIVDDKLNNIAMAINANYNLESKDEIYNKWINIDSFAKKSNIYAALNLRFKLNLLGLDYIEGNMGENLIQNQIGELPNEFDFDYYNNQNIITALIAQEHARWNAYHIISGYVPMKKCDVTLNKDNMKFSTKNPDNKQHVCITTYDGLKELAKYQLEESIKYDSSITIERFDVYKYDLLLIKQANNMLNKLGYKVIKR